MTKLRTICGILSGAENIEIFEEEKGTVIRFEFLDCGFKIVLTRDQRIHFYRDMASRDDDIFLQIDSSYHEIPLTVMEYSDLSFWISNEPQIRAKRATLFLRTRRNLLTF